MTNFKQLLAALALIAGLSVSGCGIKGELTRPSAEAAQPESAIETARTT